MIKPQIAYPTYLGLIRCAGPDAQTFLQGQLTNDIRLVTPTEGQISAYCNHKGRIITLFHIFYHENCYYLSLPAELRDSVFAALKKFGAFSKIDLEIEEKYAQIPPAAWMTAYPNISAPLPTDELTWQLQQIELGMPEVLAETTLLFTPHELNLPRLGAVSFTKGCYRGQEIVARMEHLGKHQHGMYKAKINFADKIAAGIDILNAQQQTVGKVIMSAAKTNQLQVALVTLKNFVDTQKYYLLIDDKLILINVLPIRIMD